MTRKNTVAKDKPRKKKALGRGLEALFPDIEPVQDNGRASDYFLCDLDLIAPNRYQSRTRFSEEELSELAASIQQEGVIQPMVVRRVDSGYELVAGERRLRAAKMAGLTQVPVIVREISDRQHLIFSIVENVQRENLNPLEEADGYHALVADFGFSQEQVAASVGKSRSAIANFLRLRNLPGDIKDSLREGLISMGHARALLAAKTPQQQKAVWQDILARGLSVRQTEDMLSKAAKDAGQTRTKPAKTPSTSEQRYYSDLADNFSRRLGTQVQIKRQGKKGKIEIAFYSDDDLDRVLTLLEKI
ncbi:MAG: ParB/RepB/Spo0J family partition protein [Desulfosudaceae bacterium]